VEKNKLLLLFAAKRLREIEMRISQEYKHQEIRCPVHLSVGQEAPSAALSLLVDKNDFSVSTHRGHAHYLAKGGNLRSFIAEIYGKLNGCSRGKGGSMHLIDLNVNFMGTSAIVGNSIPTGTGLALAAKINKSDQISIIHIGDGAIEEGVFYESLNFAVVKEIPALFFCENNFYSVYSSLDVRQPEGRSLTKLANAIGSYAIESDGNCAFECYKNIKKAINYCRTQKKPVFLELRTYRWLEHCGPNFDDHLNYRKKEEIDFWKEKDPIKLLEKTLSNEEADEYLNFCKNLEDEINNAFDYAKSDLPPHQDSAYSHVISGL
tara:strand:+ start:83 stop:1042 length:960 start_codon:yes stop_codon:yes gene_type:complete